MPPSIWPDDLGGVQHPADVLAGGDLDDPHEAEVGVDVDDGPVGGEGEADVGVALAPLVEGHGGPVAVDGGRLVALGRRRPRPR